MPDSNLEPPKSSDFTVPAIRVWYYAGPILLDALALICTTILVAIKIVPVEDFKYLVGILVVGNVALRMPGGKPGTPPGGGGLIVGIIVSAITTIKGIKS